MNPLIVLSNPRGRRRRKKTTSRRRRARAAAPARRRRRKSAAARVFKLRRNPRRRRHHRKMRTRRNPSSLRGLMGGASITSMLVPGFLGAAGALGLDYAYSKASPYLPASLQGNYYLSAALKLGAAIAVAKFGRKVVKPQTAVALGAGIAVVTLYDVGQILMGTLIPAPAPAAVPLSGLGSRVSLNGGRNSLMGMGSRIALGGLGYTGSGVSIDPGSLPHNRFTGVGEYGDYGHSDGYNFS
jgi:hypothetical protein